MGRPPPIIRAMPERKRFFSIDVFPNLPLFPGVRPYRCHHCEKSFTQRCSLESHCLKVHGVNHQYEYKQRRSKVVPSRQFTTSNGLTLDISDKANVVFPGLRLRGLRPHDKGTGGALLALENPAPVLPGPPQVLRQEAFQVQLLTELFRECDDVARADLLSCVHKSINRSVSKVL